MTEKLTYRCKKKLTGVQHFHMFGWASGSYCFFQQIALRHIREYTGNQRLEWKIFLLSSCLQIQQNR
jgi:hypothetical protein